MPRQGTRKIGADRAHQVLEQTDLTGGLDLRRSPTLIGPTRSRECHNISIGEPGALAVRPGFTAWSSPSLGSSGVQGGVRAYLASTQVTVVAWGGNLYLPTDSGGMSTTPVHTGLSATVPTYFVYDRNLVAAMDGVSTPVKSTDGQTWTRLGIVASSRASTVTASTVAGAELSTSEFEIAFTYKDRGLVYESDGGPVSTVTVTDTGKAITVNIPNSTDPQVDAIVVYARSKTAGETVLRKVSSLAQSSGVSSTYVIMSSAWSANAEIPTTHGAAPILGFGVNWKNRWWARDATVGNRLWFTELFQPQAWYALYYIDIPFERGDEITALVPQGDTLLVFGGTKPYLVIGQTSLDFEVRPSAAAQAGALGPRAVEVVEQGVLHAASEGVFLFDGATDQLLSFDIDPGWRDLIENESSTSLAKVAMVYDYLRKEIRVAVPRLYPIGMRGEWVLNLTRTREGQTPAWATTDRNMGGYIPWNGDEPTAGNRGLLLSWSPTAGFLYRENNGLTANSSNMVASYEGPHFTIGLHRARYIDAHVDYQPAEGALAMEFFTDDISRGTIQLNIGGAGSGDYYDSAEYDVSVYAGTGRSKAYTPLPLDAEGRASWVRFVYTGQDALKLFAYAIGLVPESGVRRFTE